MGQELLHVVTIVGTRPEIIRLSRVISRLNESKSIKHTLIHTGQNYDYNLYQVFFEELEIKKPDIFLEAAGDSAAETIGNILIKTEPVLKKLNPDALLLLGDTNSCLSAIVAKKYKIPIFHMEAGNRCFDQNVPEETNRKIVDHIADINLPYSSIAREYLLKEGISADRIIKTGSPMNEVIKFYSDKINQSLILKSLSLKKGAYFVVSSHREENVDNPKKLNTLISTLNILAEKYNYPIIFSTHPRTRKQLEKIKVKPSNKIQFLDPLSFMDYNALQLNSFLVLSDSGTISEEASILNFKAINVRSSHERPEAMEEAIVMFTDLNQSRILRAVTFLENTSLPKTNEISVLDYRADNVSEKIEKIILSYTDYVNQNMWKKES
ncbi:UDP-N-acetylglucosamine 2-epimerase (non-hydrolyzing) [Flavobacteriaceae bacterium]|nr:UDP-N-acetylglucosamine 2-epimerase (non-hydrolyzing) [Flavobacteriaceae bacterium]